MGCLNQYVCTKGVFSFLFIQMTEYGDLLRNYQYTNGISIAIPTPRIPVSNRLIVKDEGLGKPKFNSATA